MKHKTSPGKKNLKINGTNYEKHNIFPGKKTHTTIYSTINSLGNRTCMYESFMRVCFSGFCFFEL